MYAVWTVVTDLDEIEMRIEEFKLSTVVLFFSLIRRSYVRFSFNIVVHSLRDYSHGVHLVPAKETGLPRGRLWLALLNAQPIWSRPVEKSFPLWHQLSFVWIGFKIAQNNGSFCYGIPSSPWHLQPLAFSAGPSLSTKSLAWRSSFIAAWKYPFPDSFGRNVAEWPPSGRLPRTRARLSFFHDPFMGEPVHRPSRTSYSNVRGPALRACYLWEVVFPRKGGS